MPLCDPAPMLLDPVPVLLFDPALLFEPVPLFEPPPLLFEPVPLFEPPPLLFEPLPVLVVEFTSCKSGEPVTVDETATCAWPAGAETVVWSAPTVMCS
ncbi:MAG: hypothetical protein E6I18_12585 [Chloroflexi bacterium]|nr:MAG: hypothetical protein E6I18_12585 [Chloroflexota bacterium]